MDLQDVADAMTGQSEQTRAEYHLTLGELIDALEDAPADLTVVFGDDEGGAPTKPHSYRGYYTDLGFERTDDEVKVVEFLIDLQDVKGSELRGYKGGDFLMDGDTPLWQAEWGTAGENPPIMDTRVTDDQFTIVLGDPVW